jgi:rfaE bifunctional protein kinase chain/domain
VNEGDKFVSGPAALGRLAFLLTGERVVLIHGHFNVIHPGHQRFITHARALGTRLVVALMSDRELEAATPGRQTFPQVERAETLASRGDIDHVVLLNGVDLAQVIATLRPARMVLGKEFEDEHAGRVADHVALVKQHGGQVVYHSGHVSYAGEDLLGRRVPVVEDERLETFRQVCLRQDIDLHALHHDLDSFRGLDLLVLGDTIVDQFVACDAVGMSGEAPVLVLKELKAREFVGGAAIVACHLRSLGARCHFLSVTGEDQPAELVRSTLVERGVAAELFTDSSRPTTFKIRYLVGQQKLLRVSRLVETSIPRAIEERIIARIEAVVPQMDGVVVSDFVYGVVTPRILEALAAVAHRHQVPLFGDLQCSSQVGNVLRFQRFSLIAPNEREARIALGDNDSGIEQIAHRLLAKSGCSTLLLTLGANGFIAYDGRGPVVVSESFPALEVNPVDVAGAGDALLSAVALCTTAGWPLMRAAALGACVAALAVGRVGNVPIGLEELKDYVRRAAGEPALTDASAGMG